jgi:hypothetical protein
MGGPPALASFALGSAPARGSGSARGFASGSVTPCSAPPAVTRGSASGAMPVPGSVSASQVMSSLPPEPVFRSSASDLALPSSVAGRDGTRLKYRSGLALHTNNRVVRKCPAPCLCQYNAPLGRACAGSRLCAPGGGQLAHRLSVRLHGVCLTSLPTIHRWAVRAAACSRSRRSRAVPGSRCRHPASLKMSDPRAIFEQTSKTTGHLNEFRFE